MTARFDLVTIDSPSPDAASTFWCAALALHETEREDGDRWIVLSDLSGVRRLGLQRGSARPGTVHLDVVCTPGEFASERRRLLALGASEIMPVRELSYGLLVNLADPDGNPFDLCAYI